ncbi:hypothetical protein ACFE04_031480 [Oxalis oulophora]
MASDLDTYTSPIHVTKIMRRVLPPLWWYSSLPPPPFPVTLIDSREFFYREKHGNSASTWEDLMTMISEILSENSIGGVHTARRCNYDRIDYEYYGDSDGGSWWSRGHRNFFEFE